ncbi:MAG: SurA N-terminal domain-containing protein [Proteobacteria bacterium]|nr:SurA N-terminal domain-containing protein [Pseudomonadota bacterium]
MLQILRRKAQSPFIQVIVVIIALVFIFWGVGTNIGDSKQSAIVINGEEISFQQFQQAYDRAYQQLGNQFGGNVPKGLAESFGLKQQVINQIIQTALLRQGATAMGIEVSGDEIRSLIQSMPQFQEQGSFSLERYKAILATNKMAPTKFEQSMRFDQLSEVAVREIGGFATIATDYEIQDIYSQLNEKVAVKYARISSADYVDKVVIEETTLAAWFETVKEKYKTESQVKLKYLTFTFAEVGNKVTIDQPKIEEYYSNNLNTFKIPEQRHARHILLQAGEEDSSEIHQEKAAKAAKVLDLAKSGEDFIALAQQYSEGPSKNSGGDLGFFPAGQMVPAFDQAVFSMQPGAISDVVKTQFGYHIIKLEGIKPSTTQPLAEATEKIISTLRLKEAESMAFQVGNAAYEAIISAGSLSKYSASHPDVIVRESDFFTKSSAPADLKTDPQFLEKTLDLNKGELSSLIKGQSGYLIVFVEDKKEPETPELTTVRAALEKDFRKIKSQELAEAAAKDVLQSVKAGKPFDSAAQEKGLTVQESGLLGQNKTEGKSDFPPSLLQTAFLLSTASPLPDAPGRVGDDFYVYTFLTRETPKMPENSDEMKKYRDNLQRFKQQQLLAAWLRHLEIGAKITKHPSL